MAGKGKKCPDCGKDMAKCNCDSKGYKGGKGGKKPPKMPGKK